MKITKYFMYLLLSAALFTGCDKDDIDEKAPKETDLPGEEPKDDISLEVKDFVWKGMNNIYLYKSRVPVLADDYFSTQTELNEYLMTWNTPEALFYEGLVAENFDQFSWIVEDYELLESQFSGTDKSAGFRYGWAYAPNSNSRLVAYVIYVSPEGPAGAAGLKRGDYISQINGSNITLDNYQGIFSNAGDDLQLQISKVENGTLVDSGDPLNVTKIQFKEDTSPISKVLNVDGLKIGYLYLTSFLGEFGVDDSKINAAFGEFKSQNIDELIVDLRYNQGGYSEFSVDLASMVTGQNEGEIFTQQQWNNSYQTYFEQQSPESLYSRFNSKVGDGSAINSLNLNNVYVIATGRSYSASESFIIGLEPYIDVTHIGSNTGGKFQGSVTLYDGDNFGKTNLNPDHKYAIQPLVYKYANAEGFTDFVDGLAPDVVVEESISNLGTLGELDEPLLAATIDVITGNRSFIENSKPKEALKVIPTKDERGLHISGNPFENIPMKQQVFERK